MTPEEGIQKDLTTSNEDQAEKEMREREEARAIKCIALLEESYAIYKKLSGTGRQRVDMAFDEMSAREEKGE